MSNIPTNAVPKDNWGPNHWRLLLSIEERCVFHAGVLDWSAMRCSQEKHPEVWTEFCPSADISIQLRDGTFKQDHDDWDIVKDFIVHGLMRQNDDRGEPAVVMLPEGWKQVHALREHLANDGYYTDFAGV